ncbi:hypothetical protein [Pasteuria penetrans]|nr:hypothetical protein [Pasteuria penetrans]
MMDRDCVGLCLETEDVFVTYAFGHGDRSWIGFCRVIYVPMWDTQMIGM